MLLRRLTIFAALWLPLASCTSKDATADEDATAEAKQGGVEIVEIASREPPKIDVIDAGDEPRLPLRLHPAEGTEEPVELTMGIRMGMQNGPQNMPSIPVPTTKTRMHARVEKVDADGIHVRQSVTSVEVIPDASTPPAVVEKVRESVEPLLHYRALMRMDDRGTIRGGEVEIPRDLPAMVHSTMQQMTQSLGQLSVPLPEPAVGPGARWTATNDIEQNGMKLRQTAHYTMISRGGDQAVIEVTLVQELVDPEVSVPGMLGAKARVSDFSSAGRGSIQLDQRHITPTSMTMAIDLSMTMDVTVLGQHQHVEMDMEIEMALARADQS